MMAGQMPGGMGDGMHGRRGWSARLVAALSLAMLLPGCAALGGSGPPPSIYDLTVPATTPATGSSTAQLLVPVPSAIEALDTARIAVNPSPMQISYFPAAQWSDELPRLLQAKLVRAFENSGRAGAVGRPGESLTIDFQIIVDIRNFAFDAAGDAAVVSLGVKILDDRTGRVVATRIFDTRSPSASDTADAGVAALDRAATDAIGQVIGWVLGRV